MATEETVNTIAKALGEVEEQPMTQITGVVRVLGEQTALELLAETQRVEESGGMLLPDGSRRRTPGGVFFFLARQKLSHEDKVAIFRPAKPAKPAQPAPEPTKFPRRRVIDVAPPRDAPPPSRGQRPAGGFIPPGLPLAAKRVRAREAIQNALAALPPDDQNNLLLDLLAELYERRGVRIPEPASASRPNASDGPPPSQPPPSQRPIPVPVPPHLAVPVVTAPVPVITPAPAQDEPPSSEPAPKRARATTTRATTKKRA